MSENRKGKITMIVGPMFSGKSGELVNICEKLIKYGKKKVKVYKPENDDRFSMTEIISRDSKSIEAENLTININDEVIEKILNDCKDYSVVALDEVHFFHNKIVKLVYLLADAGCDVYLAGLNLDYKTETFGKVGDLLALADEVRIKRAYCMICGKEAKYTQRIIGGRPAEYGEQVIIGDIESYEVRCGNCYVHPSRAKTYNQFLDIKFENIINEDKNTKSNSEKIKKA